MMRMISEKTKTRRKMRREELFISLLNKSMRSPSRRQSHSKKPSKRAGSSRMPSLKP